MDGSESVLEAIASVMIEIILLLICVIGFGPVMDYLAFTIAGSPGNPYVSSIMPVFVWFYGIIVLAAVLDFIWIYKIVIRTVNYTRWDDPNKWY